MKEKGAADLAAHFVSALALALPHEDARIFQGEVHGHLTFPPRGTNGFGYDPIFVPDGETLTFGEMDPAKKLAINHRTRAFEKLTASDIFQP
jgi:XTP/dITP diphosphohydrolase